MSRNPHMAVPKLRAVRPIVPRLTDGSLTFSLLYGPGLADSGRSASVEPGSNVGRSAGHLSVSRAGHTARHEGHTASGRVRFEQPGPLGAFSFVPFGLLLLVSRDLSSAPICAIFGSGGAHRTRPSPKSGRRSLKEAIPKWGNRDGQRAAGARSNAPGPSPIGRALFGLRLPPHPRFGLHPEAY